MLLENLLSENLELAQLRIGEPAFHFLLAKKVEGRSPKTLLWYLDGLSDLARFVNGRGTSPDLLHLAPVNIRAWLASLYDRKLAKSTISCRFRAVSSFFNWAVGEGLIDRTPLTNIKAPSPRKSLVPIFSDADISKMLLLCPPNVWWGARDRAIIGTFLATGIRLSESAGLGLGSVDFARDRVRIWGKGGKERVIFLSPVAQHPILHWLRFRKPRCETDALWLSEEGRPLTAHGIQLMVRRLGHRSGIRGTRCSPHTFRHTFALSFLRAGGSVRHLQEVMGHTSMKPLETYLRMLTAEDALEVHRQKDPMRRFRL